jgi:hypothetical protein
VEAGSRCCTRLFAEPSKKGLLYRGYRDTSRPKGNLGLQGLSQNRPHMRARICGRLCPDGNWSGPNSSDQEGLEGTGFRAKIARGATFFTSNNFV